MYIDLCKRVKDVRGRRHHDRSTPGASCPAKVLYVYEGERHSIRNPAARTIIVDWLKDCLDGKPVTSEKVYAEMSGKETRTRF